MPAQQGEHCIIFPDVEIGKGTRIGNFVLIRSNTHIGIDCVIGSNVDIEGDVQIGNRVSLQSFCYPTRGFIIEDDVFCGPRGTTMNDKRICYRRPCLTFVRSAPLVLRAARVGGGSILLPGVTVGENAFVGAGSVVPRDVPDRTIVPGNPARKEGWSRTRSFCERIREAHRQRCDYRHGSHQGRHAVRSRVRQVRDAGAAIVHLHARDAGGRPISDGAAYEELVRRVREECPDVITCVSLSGRLASNTDLRTAALKSRPEMASLTLGSMNFPKQACVNPPDVVCEIAARIYAAGVPPELEVFEPGFINYAKFLIHRGAIRPPYYFNTSSSGRWGRRRWTPWGLAICSRCCPTAPRGPSAASGGTNSGRM